MLHPQPLNPTLLWALYALRRQDLAERPRSHRPLPQFVRHSPVNRVLVAAGGFLIRVGRRLQERPVPATSGGPSR